MGHRRIPDKVVALRVCAVCHEDYTPRYEDQQTCGGRCSRVLGGRRNIGSFPEAFAAAARQRREMKNDAIQATCRQRWPEMSVREIEIFQFAMREGYRRGYGKGILRQRRQQKASEAA